MQEIVARQDKVMTELVEAQYLIEATEDLCSSFPSYDLTLYTNPKVLSYNGAEETFNKLTDILVKEANLARRLHNIGSTSSLFPDANFDTILKPYSHKDEDPTKPFKLNLEVYEYALGLFKLEVGEAIDLPAFKHWKQWFEDKTNNPPSTLDKGDFWVYIDEHPNQFLDYFTRITEYTYFVEGLYDAMKRPAAYVFEQTSVDSNYENIFNWQFSRQGSDHNSEKLFTNDRPCFLAARKKRYDFLEETGYWHDDATSSSPSFNEWSLIHKNRVEARLHRIRKEIEAEEKSSSTNEKP